MASESKATPKDTPAPKPHAGGAVGDTPGTNADPTKVPDVNPGVAVIESPNTAGAKAAAADRGEPVPGLSTDAPKPDTPLIPHADPVPGESKPEQPGKEVSANAHELDTITHLGWVDIPVRTADGSIDNRHALGPIQVPNPLRFSGTGAEGTIQPVAPADPGLVTPMNPSGSPTVAAAQAPADASKNPPGHHSPVSAASSRDATSHKK